VTRQPSHMTAGSRAPPDGHTLPHVIWGRQDSWTPGCSLSMHGAVATCFVSTDSSACCICIPALAAPPASLLLLLLGPPACRLTSFPSLACPTCVVHRLGGHRAVQACHVRRSYIPAPSQPLQPLPWSLQSSWAGPIHRPLLPLGWGHPCGNLCCAAGAAAAAGEPGGHTSPGALSWGVTQQLTDGAVAAEHETMLVCCTLLLDACIWYLHQCIVFPCMFRCVDHFPQQHHCSTWPSSKALDSVTST
jgi:hypothetical protein